MIKYNISGNDDGQVIIFINGAGVGTWMWKEQLNYFAELFNKMVYSFITNEKIAETKIKPI